jgi:hypothetical protein
MDFALAVRQILILRYNSNVFNAIVCFNIPLPKFQKLIVHAAVRSQEKILLYSETAGSKMTMEMTKKSDSKIHRIPT